MALGQPGRQSVQSFPFANFRGAVIFGRADFFIGELATSGVLRVSSEPRQRTTVTGQWA